MHAIVVQETGGPAQLAYRAVPDPVPGEGQVLVRVEVAGVNFIDTYHRTGLYPVPLPFVPGKEGAGVVTEVGPGVTDRRPGDRVAWPGQDASYAELVAVGADRVVAIPNDMAADIAAAAMLQGLTAHYLVHDSYALGEGDQCLIHAGAGGVGLLLVQMAKMKGATVFTTVSTSAKADLARRAGADHVIDYRNRDFREAVEAIAGPTALDVVYDGVGAATFEDGLELLDRGGTLVLFGQASGVVPPFDLSRLGTRYVTRPSLFAYIATRDELEWRAADVLGMVADGSLAIRIGARFPLAEAAAAHEALQGRRTTGKVLLLP